MLEEIRAGNSPARIFRGDMTTSFNVNEPIKFNTMYYIYGRDYTKVFGNKALQPFEKNYAAVITFTNFKENETYQTKKSGPWSANPYVHYCDINWKGDDQLKTDIQTIVNDIASNNGQYSYLKDRIAYGPLYHEKVGKTSLWVDWHCSKKAVYVFGAIDGGKTFWFYVLPTATKGRCTETFKIAEYAPEWANYLFTLTLDDVADTTILENGYIQKYFKTYG